MNCRSVATGKVNSALIMDQRIAIVVVALRKGFPSRFARHFYGAATLSVDLSIN